MSTYNLYSNSICRLKLFTNNLSIHLNYTQQRFYKKGLHKVYRDLYNRRCELGPEPYRARHQLLNWNYNSELYCFGARLNEKVELPLLQQAFTHSSYLEKMNKERSEVTLQIEQSEVSEDQRSLEVPLDMEHNAPLVTKGDEFCMNYITSYISQRLPKLPEEGISSIVKFLMTNDLHADIMSNLGGNDLVLTESYPVSKEISSQCFRAVIGSLELEKAKLFVEDFVISHLSGKVMSDLWTIDNPVGMVTKLTESKGLADVEYRLLRETAKSTILSSYVVGVYSDKVLIGKGFGETVSTAEQMAANNVLEHYFEFSERHNPFANTNNECVIAAATA